MCTGKPGAAHRPAPAFHLPLHWCSCRSWGRSFPSSPRGNSSAPQPTVHTAERPGHGHLAATPFAAASRLCPLGSRAPRSHHRSQSPPVRTMLCGPGAGGRAGPPARIEPGLARRVAQEPFSTGRARRAAPRQRSELSPRLHHGFLLPDWRLPRPTVQGVYGRPCQRASGSRARACLHPALAGQVSRGPRRRLPVAGGECSPPVPSFAPCTAAPGERAAGTTHNKRNTRISAPARGTADLA